MGGIRAVWALGLLGLAGIAGAAAADDPAATVTVRLGDVAITAEVADDTASRRQGLSGRDQLARNRGMLFVWSEAGPRSFWMKDTTIPLSIAFMDRRGRILNIERMAPLRQDRFHRSQGLARYALEMNQGWFAQHGVEAGDRARFRLPGGPATHPAREKAHSR